MIIHRLLLGSFLLATASSGALAQTPPATNGTSPGRIDSRPAFETEYWTGSSVHSQNSGLKLLCTLQSKNTPDQNVTMTWDGKALGLTVSQRVQPRRVMANITAQGVSIAANQAATSSALRTISGVTLTGENVLTLLKGKSSIDIQLTDDPTNAMTVVFNGLDSALEQLATCMK